MRDELRKKLRENRSRLVEELEVSASFLAAMVSRGVITEEDKVTIQKDRAHHARVDTLIEILGRKSDRKCETFCSVLRNYYSDLFDLLNEHEGSSDAAEKGAAKNDPVNSPPPDAPLTRMTESNEELKWKTRKWFARIKASLDPKGHVVDTLFEEEIITAMEHTEITNGPDKETRACCLLSHLFETPHPRAFVVFREALMKDYGWVVEFIDKAQ